MKITGATRVLAIIGDPIQQVRSPEVFNALFRLNNVDAVMVPLQVSTAGLDDFLRGAKALRNIHGLVVTIPHKPGALRHVGHPTERARRVGAVNILRLEADGQWAGDIVDGVGFVEGLRLRGKSVEGHRALVVGSGGAGTAIAFALAEARAAEIGIFDVARNRAGDVATRLQAIGVKAHAVAAADPAGYDLAVNATPLGLKAGDPLPMDLSRVGRETIVADAVVYPRITPLLAAAQARGCFVQPGASMMDTQMALQAKFFGFESGDWSPDAIARVVG